MIEDAFKNMEKYLKESSDASLIDGYKRAKADYDRTGNIFIKSTVDIIKKEIDRRKIKVEE